jgi:hypothetical protein
MVDWKVGVRWWSFLFHHSAKRLDSLFSSSFIREGGYKRREKANEFLPLFVLFPLASSSVLTLMPFGNDPRNTSSWTYRDKARESVSEGAYLPFFQGGPLRTKIWKT